MIYKSVLQEKVQREINGSDYVCSKKDRVLLNEMLSMINDA